MTNTPKALAAQRAKRKANLALGLTTYGTPRRNYRWPELDGLSGRERMNERIRLTKLRHERAQRNGGLGWVLEKNPVGHRQWRYETKILLALIEDIAHGCAQIYFELPPKAKVAVLRLEERLSKFRRGLV